ncbi:MAG: catalase [Lachnospiraceae bacterium]|nr:catalase [Lachnospiraceae bacterium]
MASYVDGQLNLKKIRRHLRTILHHRHLVFSHCRRCGLFWQGLVHDLSKFSPTEFLTGARYFQGTQSPNDAERRAQGASFAWMHHKGRNRHHYEYWTDYRSGEKEPRIAAVPMPNRYIIEMLCDRVAACETYYKDKFDRSQPLAYFEHCKTDSLMHPVTAKKLRALLQLYAEIGEETFDRIREGK